MSSPFFVSLRCVPVCAFDLDKGQAKQLFEDVQHTSDCRIDAEILGDAALIELVVLLQHQCIVEAVVPEEVVVCFTSLTLLELLQNLDFFQSTRRKSLSQVAKEVVDSLRGLCHLVFDPESGVVWIA